MLHRHQEVNFKNKVESVLSGTSPKPRRLVIKMDLDLFFEDFIRKKGGEENFLGRWRWSESEGVAYAGISIRQNYIALTYRLQ